MPQTSNAWTHEERTNHVTRPQSRGKARCAHGFPQGRGKEGEFIDPVSIVRSQGLAAIRGARAAEEHGRVYKRALNREPTVTIIAHDAKPTHQRPPPETS